jgi:hypothetical protein
VAAVLATIARGTPNWSTAFHRSAQALDALRWLVVVVMLVTALTMFRAARVNAARS